MKRFYFKLLMFCLPIIIPALPIIILLWYMGFLFSFDQIAHRQSNQQNILYAVSADESGYYKEAVIAERQPSVLLLGSSRVLSFRAEFCNQQPASFYNGGLRTLDNETMAYFGERFINAHSPEILLLGLDQPYFTANYQRPFIELIDENFSQNQYILSQVKGFALQIPNLMSDEWAQLFNRVDALSGDQAIGTFAILRGVGHRSDGSFQYGQGELNADIIGSISTPDLLFEPASELGDDALTQLDRLLSYAAEHDVQVIGFFPPFSPDVYDRYFAANPENYTYLPELISTTENMFATYNFSVHDFTDPASLNITDDMMMDGWHMSERASLMLYLELLEREQNLLGTCSDAEPLQAMLTDSEHPFTVVPR